MYRTYRNVSDHGLRRWAARALAGLVVAGLWVLTPALAAEPLPTLRISVLQYGTAHWELDYLQRAGLDRQQGFELQLQPVANLPASRLALASDSVEAAVADLLWVQSRYEAGMDLLYVPFSSRIGELVVAADAAIDDIADLAGKRIGVAGGPDSKGWILLQRVAKAQGLDLVADSDIQYAAPPLLSEALRRGRLDAVVTYWHFAARLQAGGGARRLMPLSDLLAELSLAPQLPVLGYVFDEHWSRQNRALVDGFVVALRKAKTALMQGASAWDGVRPLMRAPDDLTFEALRAGFVAGTPAPLDEARIAALQQLLVLTGTDRERVMPASLFYREAP